MKKIYVIAHTWQDVELTIEYYHTNHKALKRVAELIGDLDGLEKPLPEMDVEDYLAEYWECVREQHDNMTGDYTVALKIID